MDIVLIRRDGHLSTDGHTSPYARVFYGPFIPTRKGVGFGWSGSTEEFEPQFNGIGCGRNVWPWNSQVLYVNVDGSGTKRRMESLDVLKDCGGRDTLAMHAVDLNGDGHVDLVSLSLCR